MKSKDNANYFRHSRLSRSGSLVSGSGVCVGAGANSPSVGGSWGGGGGGGGET